MTRQCLCTYVILCSYAHWPRGAVKTTVALQLSDQNAISLQAHEQVVKWSGVVDSLVICSLENLLVPNECNFN